MKNLFSIFFLLLLAANVSWSQEAPTTPTEESEKLANSLLWEVSGNGLTTPSYVYGTIHMINKDDYFLTDATKEAMDSSKRFTFEIDMEDMTDVSVLMPLMMKSFMRGDTSLKDLLTTEEYKMVADHFQKLGLPMMMLDRIKPMFLSALSGGGEDMMNPSAEGSSIVSYEMEFTKIAKSGEKEIEGLETADFQMSMFDSIPYKAQAQMLLESIKSGGETSESDQFKDMVKLYKDQNIEGMITMMGEEGGIADYENLLLVNRNKNWIPIMSKMMAEQATFFAVGAGHLGGYNGVIRLLQREGYTLKPLF